MKKKIWVYLATFLCVIVFCFMALVVFMMIAPGTSVFGVKYISVVVGRYDNKQSVDIMGDLYLDTYDLPVEIGFGTSSEVIGVHLVQKYQGFTKSKNTPDISIKTKDGGEYQSGSADAAYVSINQYRKFVWANRDAEAYVKVILPVAYAASTQRSVYVTSKNSAITITGAVQKNLNNLSITTGKGVSFDSIIKVNGTLTLNTMQGITLGTNVEANNVDVNIENAGLNISNKLDGNLNFTSKSGSVKFAGCKGNATIKTSSGNISATDNIGGKAKFETAYGTIEAKNIGDDLFVDSNNVVTIGDVGGFADVTTKRSAIVLGNVGSCNVKSNTGSIKVAGTTKGNFAASTTTGDITCGNVAQHVDKVKTQKGKITFTGEIGGKVVIEQTTSGDVLLGKCGSIEDISINGGKIVAYNPEQGIVVTGNAKVTTNKGDLTVKSIGGNADISSTGGTINITEVVGNLEINKNISNANGNLIIGSAGSATIKGINCNVRVVNCGAANITTTGGEIVVGKSSDGTNGSIASLNASSVYNNVKAYNVSGDVVIGSSSKYSGKAVELTCTGSGNVTIYADGAINATGLGGNVTVAGKANINLTCGATFGKVAVKGYGNHSNVEVHAENLTEVKTYRVTCGTDGSAHVYKGQEHSSSKDEHYGSGLNKDISISSNNCSIVAKLYLPANLYPVA